MLKPMGTATYVRYAHELAFSIYFPLLAIMANAIRSILHPATNSWVDNLYSLIGGCQHAQSYEDPKLRFTFAFLWAISAIVLFVCLRTLATHTFTQIFLRTFAGIVALAGSPLALWYVVFRSNLRVFGFPGALAYAVYFHSPHWLAVEVVVILIFGLLFALGKWALKPSWSLVVLTLHFAIWAWLVLLGAGSGNILLWPGYSWTSFTRAQPSLIYPVLGLLASVAWGLYIRQRIENFGTSSASL